MSTQYSNKYPPYNNSLVHMSTNRFNDRYLCRLLSSKSTKIKSYSFQHHLVLTYFIRMAQRLIRLSRQNSLLFLCDLQEKFRPTIKYFPQIVETSNKLLQVCKILDVPFVVTEQYPKGC